MGVLTLICECGMRLKAPGAVPGRVGKCPRCGSLLKVPDAPPAAKPVAVAPGVDTFVDSRPRKRPGRAPAARPSSDGLLAGPKRPETRLVVSLGYPLWNATGLGILAFFPPMLWFLTLPLFTIVPTMASGSAYSVLGFVLIVPLGLILGVVGGHVLLFFGQVLTTSAAGEVAQPRPPGWGLSEIARGLRLWACALAIGGVVGGLPPLLYWMNCGDVDWLDRIVLVDLIVPGMAYAQMALLAALLRESALAANPVTVCRAIVRAGWAYIGPCATAGSCLLAVGALFLGVLKIENPPGQAVAFWASWVVALYAAMVVLRRLGLFCFRRAIFDDRARGRDRPEAEA